MLDNLISDLGLKFVGDRKFRFGIFKCKKCNKEFEIQIRRKTKGELCKSCNTIKSKSTHNKTRTKLYYIWTSMKDRCCREKTNSFPLYGGRGITICDEWKSNFIFFYDWAMANGYQAGLSIDRKDNDGNYEPDNCRWVNQTIQSRNTRKIMKTNTTGYRGVSKQNSGYISRIMVNKKSKCIGTFRTAEEAGRAYDKYITENNLEHTRNFN